MVSPYENPAIRYGVAFSTAALLAVVAIAFMEGIARWVILGLAVTEIVVIPQLLKQAV